MIWPLAWKRPLWGIDESCRRCGAPPLYPCVSDGQPTVAVHPERRAVQNWNIKVEILAAFTLGIVSYAIFYRKILNSMKATKVRRARKAYEEYSEFRCVSCNAWTAVAGGHVAKHRRPWRWARCGWVGEFTDIPAPTGGSES